jgi:hypothetical protein
MVVMVVMVVTDLMCNGSNGINSNGSVTICHTVTHRSD